MSDTTTTPTPAVNDARASVEAPTPAQPEPKPQPPAAPAEQRDAADLGDAGKKAIQREREAREAAERELKAQRAAILKAFGVEQDKGSTEDVVATLQRQFADMQKDNVVNTVARRHKLDSEEDVELLRALPDEAAMDRFAARLKQQTPPAPNAPAPDPSQASAPMTEEAAADAAYKAFFPS